MTTSYSFSFDDSEGLGFSAEEQPKSQTSSAWERFKSGASDAWEWLKPHAGEFIKRRAEKWIDTLVWLGLLALAYSVSWLFVLAVLVVAYLMEK